MACLNFLRGTTAKREHVGDIIASSTLAVCHVCDNNVLWVPLTHFVIFTDDYPLSISISINSFQWTSNPCHNCSRKGYCMPTTSLRLARSDTSGVLHQQHYLPALPRSPLQQTDIKTPPKNVAYAPMAHLRIPHWPMAHMRTPDGACAPSAWYERCWVK